MLRPDTLAMTAMLALLTALGPLSTDLYLPSLPHIARDFGTGTAEVQLTLSVFLFGFAFGQIFYGPLADRLGRKPVLLAGLGLFLLASILCAMAPSIDVLIAGRFLQALGGSAPIVLGRAMVRDLYEGPRAGRELARMGMIMGLVPAFAPLIGSAIETWLHWRYCFWLCVAFAIGLGVVAFTRLPETLRRRSPHPVSFTGYLGSFGVLAAEPRYRVYAALVALAYAGLFSFISGSSFLLQESYRLAPRDFAGSFSLMVIGYIGGTIAAQRLVDRRGLDGVIRLGVACLALGGLAMLALTLFGTGSSLEITVPMMLYAFGVGLTMPQGQAAAMMPFPERAGAASSLLGLVQMTLAGVVGVAVGHTVGLARWSLPLAIALSGVLAYAIFRASTRLRAGR
jgi:DHA1 family bicyclomycin/chloramphenicol resistance-like MFS transporter